MAGFARQSTHHRHLECHVRSQHSQWTMRWMVIVHGNRRHQSVDRDHTGVVGDHKRSPGEGNVLDPTDLDAKPLLEQRAQHRHDDVVREMRVEPELVDLVVAGHPTSEEFCCRGDLVDDRRPGRIDERALTAVVGRRGHSGRMPTFTLFTDVTLRTGDGLTRTGSCRLSGVSCAGPQGNYLRHVSHPFTALRPDSGMCITSALVAAAGWCHRRGWWSTHSPPDRSTRT